MHGGERKRNRLEDSLYEHLMNGHYDYDFTKQEATVTGHKILGDFMKDVSIDGIVSLQSSREVPGAFSDSGGELVAKSSFPISTDLLEEFKSMIDATKPRQKDAILRRDQEEMQKIYLSHDELLKQVKGAQIELQEYFQSRIMDHRDLESYKMVMRGLLIVSTQVELLQQELRQYAMKIFSQPVLTLLITKEPFPQVFRQTDELKEGELEVMLLCGSTVCLHKTEDVEATVVNITRLPADKSIITNEKEKLDANTLSTTFKLKFLEGTRKNFAQIRFCARILLTQFGNEAPIRASIETNTSRPFIVMTNQKQWEGCERFMFVKNAFGDRDELRWCELANHLQLQFITMTKQCTTAPERLLSIDDMSYLHRRFFHEFAVVKRSDFDEFWDWYGKTLQVIKYQRHIAAMWLSGLLLGYATRTMVESLLTYQKNGSFLVRFSERNAGQFAIAYKNANGQLHHYLVKPNDTAGAKITFPDFLRDSDCLTRMMKLTSIERGATTQWETKDDALRQFYVRKKDREDRETSTAGYQQYLG